MYRYAGVDLVMDVSSNLRSSIKLGRSGHVVLINSTQAPPGSVRSMVRHTKPNGICTGIRKILGCIPNYDAIAPFCSEDNIFQFT